MYVTDGGKTRKLDAHSRRAGKQNRGTHPGEGEREKTDADRPIFTCGRKIGAPLKIGGASLNESKPA